MKIWKRPLALLLAGAMILSLAACGDGGDAESPSGGVSAGPEASASPEIEVDLTQGALEFSAGLSPAEPLLTVNGAQVPADLLLYWLYMNCTNFLYQYGLYGMSVADYAQPLLDNTVTICSYHALLRERAAQLGCLPTDAQVQQARESMMAQGQDYYDQFKASFGLTDESMDYFFLGDAYYDNVRDAVTHAPDAQELDEYLESRGIFSVKHILLMTVDQLSGEPLEDGVIAEKKALADSLLAQLQAADDLAAKFDELMNEYSEDSGLDSNPDGYIFDSDDSLVGGFREAALALEEGGLSGVVETDYGYHIMLRQALTDEDRTNYAMEFQDDALTGLLEQWLADSEVVRAPALDALDPADFYNRLSAYQQALSAQEEGVG